MDGQQIDVEENMLHTGEPSMLAFFYAQISGQGTLLQLALSGKWKRSLARKWLGISTSRIAEIAVVVGFILLLD